MPTEREIEAAESAIMLLLAGKAAVNYGSIASAALEAAERVRGDGWMPIESAPKDGRAFIAIDKFRQQWVCVRCESGEVVGLGQRVVDIAATVAKHATHWRPLPPPPKASEEVG